MLWLCCLFIVRVSGCGGYIFVLYVVYRVDLIGVFCGFSCWLARVFSGFVVYFLFFSFFCVIFCFLAAIWLLGLFVCYVFFCFLFFVDGFGFYMFGFCVVVFFFLCVRAFTLFLCGGELCGFVFFCIICILFSALGFVWSF